jgi:hypothetical protein
MHCDRNLQRNYQTSRNTSHKYYKNAFWSTVSLRDTAHRHCQSVLCVQNVIQFYGRRVNALLLTVIKTVRLFLRWFSQESQLLKISMSRSLIPNFAQIGQQMRKSWIQIHLRSLVKCKLSRNSLHPSLTKNAQNASNSSPFTSLRSFYCTCFHWTLSFLTELGVVFHIQLHPNRPNNVDSKGQHALTPLRQVWLPLGRLSWNLTSLDNFCTEL